MRVLWFFSRRASSVEEVFELPCSGHFAQPRSRRLFLRESVSVSAFGKLERVNYAEVTFI